jgi:iron-sulfur cluster assembly protein/iron-sulfur cluster insertion protein
METITLTPAAAEKAAALRDGEAEGLALRVAVRSGGCSGFQYDVCFDSDVSADDVCAEYSVEGTTPLKVVSDPTSAQMLVGATLDYRDGLTEAGFKITNPNANRSCGCGKSFS